MSEESLPRYSQGVQGGTPSRKDRTLSLKQDKNIGPRGMGHDRHLEAVLGSGPVFLFYFTLVVGEASLLLCLDKFLMDLIPSR
jgi:hypothetical protein